MAHVGTRVVKPLLSTSIEEARAGGRSLYRAFYRDVPEMFSTHTILIPIADGRQILKEKFLENRGVTDVRLYDMMLIKARMNHEEIMKVWAQDYNIIQHINTKQMLMRGSETQEKSYARTKNTDFMDDFYNSSD